ncbi:hypothetical protein CASFOL_003535 [Castilleja foliolosa]|uniref:F-box domain-containing protein n=1 Tax=Castilleja foliolosa TaxID=1961234 RepID=A0ABD3ELC1_9LAMI
MSVGEKNILTMMSVDLPWDITTEILSRLPVKSLMRFKCVSVSFYNLISNDPLFRKKHLHHQSSFKNVIFVPHFINFQCRLVSLSLEGDVRKNRIDLKLPTSGKVSFHNSCDGLFCMSMSGGDAVIWNPTTRQVRRFHTCPSYIPYRSWIGYSLAHDSRSDVYKLLGLTITYGYRITTYKLYFYSTEKGMWRYIEEPSACDYVKYDGQTTIVNGAFHWLGSNEKRFLMPHVVVSLDISNETWNACTSRSYMG